MDCRILDVLRQRHPVWRLLAADHVALIASFLYLTRLQPDVRLRSLPELISRLDDYLDHLHSLLGVFPKSAGRYIDDSASAERVWLRNAIPLARTELVLISHPERKRLLIGWRASGNVSSSVPSPAA